MAVVRLANAGDQSLAVTHGDKAHRELGLAASRFAEHSCRQRVSSDFPRRGLGIGKGLPCAIGYPRSTRSLQPVLPAVLIGAVQPRHKANIDVPNLAYCSAVLDVSAARP